MKRLGNGEGSVYKLAGNRRKPWTARKTIGWNEKGQPKYKYIGYFRTKAEALNALMDYNRSPYSLNGERLIDIYERFFESYKEKMAATTVEAMRVKWGHLMPLYDEKISDLSRKDLQTFFDSMNATELTKHKVKVVLSKLFDYAIRYDILPPERKAILEYLDLSSNVEINEHPHNRITDEEIAFLWDMDDDISRFILFLIYTGMRSGEYQYIMDNGGIDDDMVIRIGKAKTAAGVREVPLSDKAQKLLDLPHFKNIDNMKYRYKIWREKINFDHTLHDTRHTCVSLLTEAKVDERIIRSIVGHKGRGVTEQVYTHISLKEKKDALDLI